MICRRGTESMTACSDPRAGRKRERKGESFSPSGLRGDSGCRGRKIWENVLTKICRRCSVGRKAGKRASLQGASGWRSDCGETGKGTAPMKAPRLHRSGEGLHREKAMRGKQQISSLHCSRGRAFLPSRSQEDFCGDLRRSAHAGHFERGDLLGGRQRAARRS